MRITKGRLKQIIKEEVENFSTEITENDASLDNVKSMMASVAQGLLREPPVLPTEQQCDELYRGLKSIAQKEEPDVASSAVDDLGGINE
tara:strand:+ start:2725 stop:2991 length:267 start_codon:yes stop_codon:yes gene_type:complete